MHGKLLYITGIPPADVQSQDYVYDIASRHHRRSGICHVTFYLAI